MPFGLSNRDLVLQPPERCRPWWAPQFDTASHELVTNGGKAVDGVVPTAPELLRRAAQAALTKRGFDLTVTPSMYALARTLASERGPTGTSEEKMALALLTINYAKAAKTDPYGLLALRNKWKGATYGPIHGSSIEEAPYGRWASTSQDPSVRDMLISAFALSGKATLFVRGGNAQYSGILLYDAILSDLSKNGILGQAKRGNYWVGPLANVNALKIFIYAPVKGVAWDSPTGQQLITRAKTFLRSPEIVRWVAESRRGQKPSWMPYPPQGVCTRRFLNEPAVQRAIGAAGLSLVAVSAWAAGRHEKLFRPLWRRFRV